MSTPFPAFCLTQVAFKYETIFRVSQVLLNNGTDLSSAIPNVPNEVTCGYLCLHDDTCKAFFYDNTTLLCKPEQQCRLVVVFPYVFVLSPLNTWCPNIYIEDNVKLRLSKFLKGSHCAMYIRGKIIQCKRYFCLLLAKLYLS